MIKALLCLALPGLLGVAIAQEPAPALEESAPLASGPAEWAQGPRPTPGLWLVIDDGRGPRLVLARQGNAVAPLVQAAADQGLSLRLPQGGTQDDREGIAAAWENDEATIRRLAGRYGSGELLLGRLSRSGSGWQAQWRVVDSLGEVESFSRSGADALALLGEVGSISARHLAQRSQDLLSAGPPGEHDIVIEGLRSAEDFIRVRAYLDSMAVVRGVQTLGAEGNSLNARLSLATGIDRFDALLDMGGVLARDGVDRDAPRYRLR